MGSFSSVQSLSCVGLCDHNGLQHARLRCPSWTPGACSNSCPSSQWCHPTISSSVVPFSSHLQSFPVSQFFASGSQSIRVSASASVLPMNIQDWFPLGLTGLISLQSKRLSRAIFSTTVQKHQFFSAQFLRVSFGHTIYYVDYCLFYLFLKDSSPPQITGESDSFLLKM